DEASSEDLDQAGEGGGLDDDVQPERPAARQRYLPSSIGVSILLPASAKEIRVKVSWGDYKRRSESPEEWERKPNAEWVSVELTRASERPLERPVPNSK